MATKRTMKKTGTAAAKPVSKETKVVQPAVAEVKEEAKAPEKVAEVVVEPVKEAEKPAEKKATVPKKTAKKEEVAEKGMAKEAMTNVYVQFMGKEILAKDIVAEIKKAWMEATGKKEEDLESLEVYIKPEESKAYYVINGAADGSYIEL